jgi:hypothetical protein
MVSRFIQKGKKAFFPLSAGIFTIPGFRVCLGHVYFRYVYTVILATY